MFKINKELKIFCKCIFVLFIINQIQNIKAFGNGIEDISSHNFYQVLEPNIKHIIETKHLDPHQLSNTTFETSWLPTVHLYNGNMTGLSNFKNESFSTNWDKVTKLITMNLRLVFPELKIMYRWKSIIGKGLLYYFIYDMRFDLNIQLDLQSLQLKINHIQFNSQKATTEIGVSSKFMTSVLNAVRNRIKGLNNWILNPVTDKMNQAIHEQLKEKNIDIYQILGIRHLYNQDKVTTTSRTTLPPITTEINDIIFKQEKTTTKMPTKSPTTIEIDDIVFRQEETTIRPTTEPTTVETNNIVFQQEKMTTTPTTTRTAPTTTEINDIV